MRGWSHLTPLSYAVRIRVVARYLGELCLVQAVLVAVPVMVGLVSGNYGFALRTAVCAVIMALVALALMRLPAARRIQSNEALVIASGAFVTASLAMIYPLLGEGLPPVDAVFEAVSGVTTTGLTTIATVEGKSAAFLFTRAWMQWYGGLGFVALSLAMITAPTVAARQLSAADTEQDKLAGGTRAHAQRLLLVYLALSGLGFGVLAIAGMAPFEALVHMLAAVSTGGFSSSPDSLAGLGGWPVRIAAIAVSFLGAVSFTLYYRAFGGRWRELVTDLELRTLLSLALTAAVILFVMLRLRAGLAPGAAAGHAFAMAFSAQSTTGFSTLAVADLDTLSRLVLMGCMFVGGDLGSTAGGIKIVRLLVLLRILQTMIQRTCTPPHAVLEPRLKGTRIAPQEAMTALAIIGLFVLVIVSSWAAFLFMGHDPLNSLFDVVSATGTVGLSTGVIGHHLHPALKAVVCIDMLLGRVEVLAILAALYPRSWIGKRAQES